MKSGILFLGVFGAFWTALVGTFDGFVVYRLVRQTLALGYPSVMGRVTHSEVTHHRGSKGGTTFGVRIEYTYFLGDNEFHGARFRYGEGSSSDSAWAHAAVKANPVGAETRVFYNPKDPADALLSPGVDGSDFMFLLFLTPFNAVMLGLWAGAGSALWQRLRRPPAGGVRLRTRLRQTRVCLAEYGPLVAFLVAVGLSGFISIFVVGFGLGGFRPRMAVILTVWAVVLGIGFSAALRQWLRIRSGRYDLVLDELAGTLELPTAEKAAQPRRVPFSAVKSVSVEQVPQRTSKGGSSPTYVPTLHLESGQGGQVRVGKFHLESRANGFADWLRQKLRLRQPGAPG
jgi:hypothetical protein